MFPWFRSNCHLGQPNPHASIYFWSLNVLCFQVTLTLKMVSLCVFVTLCNGVFISMCLWCVSDVFLPLTFLCFQVTLTSRMGTWSWSWVCCGRWSRTTSWGPPTSRPRSSCSLGSRLAHSLHLVSLLFYIIVSSNFFSPLDIFLLFSCLFCLTVTLSFWHLVSLACLYQRQIVFLPLALTMIISLSPSLSC